MTRTITLPLVGKVKEVDDRGRFSGGRGAETLGPPDILEYARAKGITVPKVRMRMRTQSLDLDAGTITMTVDGHDGFESVTDTFMDNVLTETAKESTEDVRQVIRDHLEGAEAKALLDYTVTAEQRQKYRDRPLPTPSRGG